MVHLTRRAEALAARVVEVYAAKDLKLATAESCTGGLIGAALTDISGSSAVFERGFLTYSNEAKEEMLGVDPALLDAYGAVSGEVAVEMAAGALLWSEADVAVSVTGIAGPTGGTSEKPVGTVWFGVAALGAPVKAERRLFVGGSRSFVRGKTVETALQLALAAI